MYAALEDLKKNIKKHFLIALLSCIKYTVFYCIILKNIMQVTIITRIKYDLFSLCAQEYSMGNTDTGKTYFFALILKRINYGLKFIFESMMQ